VALLGVLLLGCGESSDSSPSGSTGGSTPSRFVCFTLDPDWVAAGGFQQLLVKPEGMRQGMSGFRLDVDDDSALLEVTLMKGVEPRAWIDALPPEVSNNSHLVTVAASDSACASA
jgi:hypothetical protein